MSTEDNGTEMSEMRSSMDTVQSDVADVLSEVQESVVVVPSEAQAKYRVIMYPYECEETEWLYKEYFQDIYTARSMYDALCDDRDFVK